MVAAAACLTAAALAVTQPLPDVRPRDASALIRHALELERTGEASQAESLLLEAARIDRQYAPAWALANFYLRRNNADQFWIWAARAAPLTNDARALLRLANAVTPDPQAIITHLGNRPEILRPYLDILITELVTQPRLKETQAVAALLAAHGDPADLPRLAVVQSLVR